MDQSSETQNCNKKLKHIIDFEQKDRISSLPDEILCHILSFMPTRYAFRTSLLSTRWESIWTSVPCIDFHHYTRTGQKDDSSGFMSFVDRVLLLHNLPTINKFHLECKYGHYDAYRLNSWICNAIKLNVQELVLDFSIGFVVGLPRRLFTSVNLVVLKLAGGVLFKFPMLVFLPSLKLLHLFSMRFLNDDSFENLLSGCPVLEELDIKRFERNDMKTLCIYSSTLKKLHIHNSFYKEKRFQHGVVIRTPALEILGLRDFVSEVFDINEFPCLVKANLFVSSTGYNFELSDDSDGMVEMFRKISHVQHLTLCDSILKVVIQSSAYDLLLFHNLAHLHIDIYNIPWSFFPDLLGQMPRLKVLSFYKDRTCCDFCKWRAAPKSVPNCLSLCLETVEFGGFAGCKEELKLVRYLLKTAVVLKKMTLTSWTTDKKIKANILNLPRSSSTCQIELRCYYVSFRAVEWL